jgi:large subunit ribosomal protein L31
MKKGIHPDYREVLVHDLSSGLDFITRSSQYTKDTKEFNGKTYPLIKVEISNMSHPFYTGKAQLLDTAGRIDKWNKKYVNKK